jgi:hypothetical protein
MAESKKVLPTKAATDKRKTLLNIVFHGPFLFIYYERRVEVITPQTPEHLVGAGTWLDETQCDVGTYYLNGMRTTQKKFEPPSSDSHAIIDLKAINVGIDIEKAPYFRFILPVPWQMTALTTVPLPTVTPKVPFFVGDHASSITAKKLGTVHALTYEYNPHKPTDTPQLYNLPWVPLPSSYGNPDDNTLYNFATNLHIYAEAAFSPDPNHPIRDFAKIVTMLPNLKLALAQPFPELKFDRPTNDNKLGITREEQGGLRGLPQDYIFRPPLVCDTPSLVVLNAQDPKP